MKKNPLIILDKKQKAICQKMCDLAVELYPLESLWEIEYTTHKIFGRVVWHSDAWWSTPAEIRVENILTGKQRTFNPCFHKHRKFTGKATD